MAGCCWAFAAVAATEAAHQIRTGSLISMSVQELLDCDTTGNHGCEGGWPDSAFGYMYNNNGLATDWDYSYTGVVGACSRDKSTSRVGQILGYGLVHPNNEEELRMAVYIQPVAALIDSNSTDFKTYTGGVYNGDCGTNPDHVLAIVGYGITDYGVKYWLVKNSWGTGWGENGFGMILRDHVNKEGKCGIAGYPTYPVVNFKR